MVVVDREGKVKKFAYYKTYEAHRLEVLSTPLGAAAAKWPREHFSALEVLVGYWPCQYLESFLDFTPNLRVMSIILSQDASKCSIFSPALLHPVTRHLTHLSISLNATSSLKRVTMPSLNFLHLIFTPHRSPPTAGLPWVFPSLRSLHISGYIQGALFDALTPFFVAHSATVTRLYDDFRVRRTLWASSTSIVHFKHLDVYAVNLSDRSKNVDPPPPLSNSSSASLRPLTVLWMHAPVFIGFNEHSNIEMRMRWLKWEVATVGSYSVQRIVLDRSWDGLKSYHERSKSNLRYLRFSYELERLDIPSCPVFDRHLVRFQPSD